MESALLQLHPGNLCVAAGVNDGKPAHARVEKISALQRAGLAIGYHPDAVWPFEGWSGDRLHDPERTVVIVVDVMDLNFLMQRLLAMSTKSSLAGMQVFLDVRMVSNSSCEISPCFLVLALGPGFNRRNTWNQ